MDEQVTKDCLAFMTRQLWYHNCVTRAVGSYTTHNHSNVVRRAAHSILSLRHLVHALV